MEKHYTKERRTDGKKCSKRPGAKKWFRKALVYRRLSKQMFEKHVASKRTREEIIRKAAVGGGVGRCGSTNIIKKKREKEKREFYQRVRCL